MLVSSPTTAISNSVSVSTSLICCLCYQHADQISITTVAKKRVIFASVLKPSADFLRAREAADGVPLTFTEQKKQESSVGIGKLGAY